MNFLNFYISTFNKELKNKKYFILIFLYFFTLLHFFSFFLNRLDLKLNRNDLIADYQTKKINNDEFNNINTIFVGDSSLGNSIDKSFFNKISNLKSENLSLTGSYGIAGSLGIIKKAYKKNPNIKNFIIMHTLNIWGRPFPKNAILELYSLKDINIYLSKNEIISYLFNLKEIYWHIKYIFNIKNIKNLKIDKNTDYISQTDNKFSNNKKQLKIGAKINNIKISKGKLKEIKMLEMFCKKNHINCIFLNGPIHETYAKKSNIFINYKNEIISKNFSHIKHFEKIFAYPGLKIGDSLDHIDQKYKNESTRDIFEYIKEHLIY